MPFLKRSKQARAHYGIRIFGFRVIRERNTSFGKLVAQECYNLTHELVLNKLTASRADSRFSGNTDAAWMELDRAVREFADTY